MLRAVLDAKCVAFRGFARSEFPPSAVRAPPVFLLSFFFFFFYFRRIIKHSPGYRVDRLPADRGDVRYED